MLLLVYYYIFYKSKWGNRMCSFSIATEIWIHFVNLFRHEFALFDFNQTNSQCQSLEIDIDWKTSSNHRNLMVNATFYWKCLAHGVNGESNNDERCRCRWRRQHRGCGIGVLNVGDVLLCRLLVVLLWWRRGKMCGDDGGNGKTVPFNVFTLCVCVFDVLRFVKKRFLWVVQATVCVCVCVCVCAVCTKRTLAAACT